MHDIHDYKDKEACDCTTADVQGYDTRDLARWSVEMVARVDNGEMMFCRCGFGTESILTEAENFPESPSGTNHDLVTFSFCEHSLVQYHDKPSTKAHRLRLRVGALFCQCVPMLISIPIVIVTR